MCVGLNLIRILEGKCNLINGLTFGNVTTVTGHGAFGFSIPEGAATLTRREIFRPRDSRVSSYGLCSSGGLATPTHIKTVRKSTEINNIFEKSSRLRTAHENNNNTIQTTQIRERRPTNCDSMRSAVVCEAHFDHVLLFFTRSLPPRVNIDPPTAPQSTTTS